MTLNLSHYLPSIALTLALASGTTAGTVRAPAGTIDGATRTLDGLPKVDEFLGIPYAEPPTGHNRFAPPKPLKPWNGTYYAFKKSPSCMQAVSDSDKVRNWFMAKTAESEDCLYLNIWRPTVRSQRKIPVMVWIHGGVLVAGSASMPLYDGARLASTQQVVVVSLNYRLSFFGELFLDIPVSSGNQALQDQILGLRWVQENIVAFGGDPRKVTLFGHSSGSQSIGFHLTNRGTAGLYHNVIMQSGTPNSQSISSTKSEALTMSLDLARAAGCPFSLEHDRQEILQCLLRKNVSELMSHYKQFPNYFRLPFSLVRNGIEVPLNDVVSPLVNVPILLGTTSEESGESIKFFFPEKSYDEQTIISEKEWSNLTSFLLGLKDKRLINQSTFLYKSFNSSYNASQVRREVVEFLSDSGFVCSSISYADAYSSTGRVYMYSYNHPLPSRVWNLPSWSGTVHGAELPFVFGAPINPDNSVYSKTEVLLSMDVMNYWGQFARKSDPNEGTSVFWPPYDSIERKYLQIGLPTKVRRGLRDRKCSFWNRSLPDLLSLQRDLIEMEATTNLA